MPSNLDLVGQATSLGAYSSEDLMREVLTRIGEKPEREGLEDTPSRVTRAWGEIYGGYKENPKDILQKQFEGNKYTGMVLMKNIEFYSTCEHHMERFYGQAHVAYLPNGPYAGASKLARVVDCFARRLQIQEKLTQEIHRAIDENIKNRGVAVAIEAKHFCMMCRGVRKQNAVMMTDVLSGAFHEDPATRAEFFMRIMSK